MGAIVVIAVLVILMRRHPEALPLLVVLTLPFRLPIAADGRTVNLLVPLYLVIAAGTITQLLPRLLARRDGAASPRERAADPAVRWLHWLLLGAVVLYTLQTAYSDDRAKALENLAAFYVPFGLLFLLLREVDWTARLLRRCLGLAVILAVLFAGVGFIEYARKSLFLNPKVVEANQYDNYFRVNSVFFDPSIYGRFLALVMIAVTTAVLWGVAQDRPDRGAGARLAAGGARDELLAVEHRRAAARSGGARRLPLGRAPDALRVGRDRRARRRDPAARADQPPFRAEGLERLGRQRHQRPRHA